MLEREFLIDLFVDFGAITIRRLFSGYGISVDGVTFALSLRDGLYFRADPDSIVCFAAEGMGPFIYQNRLRTVTMNSYWKIPARLFDDSEELAQWARRALGAARTAAAKKRASRPEPGRGGSVAGRAGRRQGTEAGGKDKRKKAKGKRAAVETASKRIAPKGTDHRETVPSRKAPRKTAPRKTAARKTAARKASPKKADRKKITRKKAASGKAPGRKAT